MPPHTHRSLTKCSPTGENAALQKGLQEPYKTLQNSGPAVTQAYKTRLEKIDLSTHSHHLAAIPAPNRLNDGLTPALHPWPPLPGVGDGAAPRVLNRASRRRKELARPYSTALCGSATPWSLSHWMACWRMWASWKACQAVQVLASASTASRNRANAPRPPNARSRPA